MDGYKRMAWTLGLVFVVAVISKWINLGGDVLNLSGQWVVIVNAGLAAVFAFVINAASPWIKQYGYTGPTSDS